MKRKTSFESAVIFNDPQLTHGNKPGLWIGDGFGHAGCKDTPQTTTCTPPEVCLSVLLLKVTDADWRPCLSWHISSLFSALALPDTASPCVAVASEDGGLRSENSNTAHGFVLQLWCGGLWSSGMIGNWWPCTPWLTSSEHHMPYEGLLAIKGWAAKAEARFVNAALQGSAGLARISSWHRSCT